MTDLAGSQFIKDAGASLLVYRPGEPAPIGNVFASWVDLVAAAQLLKGAKIVFFDISLAPAVIPAGAWDFGSPTTFMGDPSTARGSGLPPFGTLVTIADGATLVNVYTFEDVQIVSQTTTQVIDAPDLNVSYFLKGSANITQTGVGGAFIRMNHANRAIIVGLYGTSAFRSGVCLRASVAAVTFGCEVYDFAAVLNDTLAGVAATIPFVTLVNAAAQVVLAQAGIPGGVLVFGATYFVAEAASKVGYVDTAPLLGAAQVQDAIDALKFLRSHLLSAQLVDAGGGVAVTKFMANVGDVGAANRAPKFPFNVNAGHYQVRLNCTTNTFTTRTTRVEVFKNAAGTGIFHDFAPGAVGQFDLGVQALAFAAGVDTFDIRMTEPGGAEPGAIYVSAVVEFTK